MKLIVHAAIAGALFGLGLAVSGMTDPDKVLNFLDLAGHWDPSLALVMGGALAVALPSFALVRRRGRTLSGDPLPAPPAPTIDRRLLIGSALFGIGWGIAGYCPGPALANLAHGTLESVVFVMAMLAGSQLARLALRTSQ
ncbi:YeeE/YedE family protein [Lysobacter sp. S4-A87]|uniref:YeeE/YedE family protein n=1 Tax=Lysobacter sp. S4-A87 TaxID=2925843 RepID=UPI001F5370E2|nr:YeeE/YedE family protein [Lysobacter sp. S4-A87]UNK50897.1 YeeE/YedE family protein [Lysobacter sp. S4-A87]